MKALRLMTCLLAAVMLLSGCSLFDSDEAAPAAVTINPDGGFTITQAPTDVPNVMPAETIAVEITPIPLDPVEPATSDELVGEPTETIDPNATPKITTTMYVSLTDTSLTLNVRNKASTKGKIVGKVSHGTQLEVYSITSGWAKLGDGFYVSSKFLTDKAPSNVEITLYDPLAGLIVPTATLAGTLNPNATPGPTAISGDITFETPKTMYVKLNNAANHLRTRAKPDTTSKILDNLSDGETVQVVSVTNGWAKLKTSPESYCMAKYLTEQAPATTTMYVVTNRTGSHLYVRDRASTAGKIVDKLTHGTAVEVVSTSKGWAKLTGGERYVRTTYLSANPPAGVKPVATATATIAPTPTSSAVVVIVTTPTPTP